MCILYHSPMSKSIDLGRAIYGEVCSLWSGTCQSDTKWSLPRSRTWVNLFSTILSHTESPTSRTLLTGLQWTHLLNPKPFSVS